MARIASFFWNAEQHRLRALWRLLLQLILLIVMILLISTVAATITMAILVIVGDVKLADVSWAAFPVILGRYPWIWPISAVSELLGFASSVWLAGRFLDRRKFSDFGFHPNGDWWIDFGFGLFLGAILMTIIFCAEKAAGWVTVASTFVSARGDAFSVAIFGALFAFIVVGIEEELFSRGYQLRNMAEGFNWKKLGPRWAIVLATLLSSAIFGVLHLGNPNATAISAFNIFLAGIMLALGYILTGKLAIPIGLHITWNFFEGNVFGFPVSGGSADTTFIAIQQGGPDLWTGGAFGPEAGLLSILVMALGVLLTVGWVYWRYGSIKLHLLLAEAPALPAPVVTASVEPESRGR